MREANGIVGVWLNVAPEHEADLEAWYEEEHIADIVAIDGFLSGRRYFDPNARLRYLALYEAVDESVEPGPGFQGIVAKPSPWTERIRRHFGEMRERLNLRRIADSGPARDPGAIITLHFEGPARVNEGLARRARLAGCTRYRAFHVADEPARGFEIYDFTTPEAAEAARPELAATESSRISVMRAVGTPHVKRTT